MNQPALAIDALPPLAVPQTKLFRFEADDSVVFLKREGILITLMIAAQMLSSAVSSITMFLLIIYSLRSTRAALQAITLSVILIFLNRWIAQPNSTTTLFRWLLFFIGSLNIILRSSKRIFGTQLMLFFMLFILVIVVEAFFTSSIIKLSLFKALSFSTGVVAAFIGFQNPKTPLSYWKSWFLTQFAIVIVLSIPFYFMTAGYLGANSALFRGIFNHSQAFSVYCIPLVGYLIFHLLNLKKYPIWKLYLVIFSSALVFFTTSRTAFLASGLAFFVLIVSGVLSGRPTVFHLKLFRSPLRLTFLFFAVIIIGLLFHDAMLAGVVQLVTKGRTSEYSQMSEVARFSFQQSRGDQIESGIRQFKQKPYTGAGFGISENVESIIILDPIFGIPITAPIEQGFLPIAVLAQTGVIGAFALLLFLITMFIFIVKYATIATSMLFWTAFFVNFGEMVFFAMGGMGIYIWLLMGLAYAEGVYRKDVLRKNTQLKIQRQH